MTGWRRWRWVLGRITGVLGLLALAAVLVVLGRGRLAGPAGWSTSQVRAWAADRDALTIAMVSIRLTALGLVGQLGLSAATTALGSALHLPSLLRAADLLAMPGTRGLARRVAGLGLTAASIAAPAAGHHATDRSSTATLSAVLDRSPASAGQATLSVAPRPAPATLRALGGRPGQGSADLTTLPARAPAATAPVRSVPSTQDGSGDRAEDPTAPTPAPPTHLDPAPDPVEPAPEPPGRSSTWRVAPGDHLWSISERTLARSWGRHPTEEQVDRYWRQVVAANPEVRHPDLLLPGQVVQVPSPPSPPASFGSTSGPGGPLR